ncbi:MAG: hypothetical protein ACTSRG_18630 [Candidatus Helarchaeota archaeon]
MSNIKTINESINLLKVAKELLSHVSRDTAEDIREKGYVTNSYLRNILDLSRRIKNQEEFILRFGYLTVKNQSNEVEENTRFYFKLKKYIETKPIEDMKTISELMEYVIMQFTVMKAKLEDEFF